MPSADPQLVHAARRHVPAAWDALLKSLQLPLHSYVAEILHDRTAALDVVQETLASAVRHIGTLRDDRRFTSWLFGIAHQKCVQHWRRTRRDDQVFVEAADASDAGDLPDGVALDARAFLLQREQADEFFILVERLPVAQRATLLLHIVEDFSLEEISAITRVPVGTVKSRLHHAKRALRQLVEASR